jgi:hypothetical protein
MNNKPLLIFPSATRNDRTKSISTPPSYRYPTKEEQLMRLNNKINELDRVLQNRTARISQSVEGLFPEMILVFEIAGRLDDFFKAIRATPGMEFLAEFQSEFSEPDDFFYNPDKMSEALETRVFLAMTSNRALNELQRYWRRYLADEGFETGTTPFRNLFQQLKDIRPYSIEDRLRDTGLTQFLEDLRAMEVEKIHFEVELAFRDSPANNQRAFNNVKSLIELAGGEVLENSRTLIYEIHYHGFIANAPIECFNDLLDSTDVSFLQAEQVMFFRPVGQVILENDDLDIATEENPIQSETYDTLGSQNLQSTVALLDGYPLANHIRLQNKVVIDDPDQFSENYPVSLRLHGTGMASLILHGDLDDLNSEQLSTPLYVRPILKAEGNAEKLPKDRLFVDLLHRAILRIKRGDENQGPIAPNIVIINLSIGDPFRPFHFNASNWAKIIDWLSFEFNVLFIVSAGNAPEDLLIDLNVDEWTRLDSKEKQALAIKALNKNIFSRKILSPSEAINAICVGAANNDASSGNNFPQNRFDIFELNSIFNAASRVGPGVGKSIKPDILAPGGRIMFRIHPRSNASPNQTKLSIETNPMNPYPPGNRVATTGSLGSLESETYTKGTSNATALVSRLGGQLVDVLKSIRQGGKRIEPSYFAVLTKALIVHGANWMEAGETLKQILNENGDLSKKINPYILHFLGYGKIDGTRVLSCTDNRVTLISYGSINKDQGRVYRFPLPNALTGIVLRKKLVITLAWISPLNFNSGKYRQAALYVNNISKKSELSSLSRSMYDYSASKRGTVQHDILEGEKADAFIEGSDLVLQVNCKEHASGLNQPVKYGLAVTLEVDEGIAIYEEIKARIQTNVNIRV